MFDEVIAVNVRGVFVGLQYAMPALRMRGGGSIVIVSSIAGIKARNTRNSAYVASKHAQIGLMRTAALEGAPYGIRVNAVAPGGMASTEGLQRIMGPAESEAPVVLRRYGSTAEVAHAVLRHRVVTNFNAEAEGINADHLVDRLLEEIKE